MRSQPQPVLRAGAAEIDITPPMGVEMCGYGPYEKRICTQILDPLYARALWLQSNGDRLLILALDLISIDIATRSKVTNEISRICGIEDKNILIAASHTHSGPAIQHMIGWGERDSDYLGRLRGLLVKAALTARDGSVAAKIGSCRQRIQGVGKNREQPRFGPLDTAAQLIRVDRADETPLAVVFNFGAHGVVRYPYTSRISADWPGLAGAYIRSALPDPVVLFLQGPCANINGHDMCFDRTDVLTRQKAADARAGDVATRLAEQVLPALKGIVTQPGTDGATASLLGAAWSSIDLPCIAPEPEALWGVIRENTATADRMTLDELRPLHERVGNETELEKAWRQARFQVDAARHQLALLEAQQLRVQAPIQILKIGDAALVGWPGEIDVELGLELRQRSPIPLTFVASFANDNVGYIPTPAAYESQGKANEFGRYPTVVTPLIYGRLPFRSDVGRILIEGTLDLLRQVAAW